MNPEMLLWLAERMKLAHARIVTSQPNDVFYQPHSGRRLAIFRPHTDRAQFADVVIWAAMEGIEVRFDDEVVSVNSDIGFLGIEYDPTPSGIMAATVEAVARAAGWTEGSHVLDA